MKQKWSNKFLLLFFLIFSVFYFSRDGENYLIKLEKKITATNRDDKKLHIIANEELKKFKKTKDSLFYIAYKFSIFHSTNIDRPLFEQFKSAIELAKLNSGKYPIVTSMSFGAISLYLEKYSPEMGIYFIDKAIENEKTSPHEEFLPHIFHMKGRLLLNEKKYREAYYYFNEALNKYNKENYLYRASMHNNIGLVYNEEKKFKQAINEFKTSLEILKKTKTFNNEVHNLYCLILGNLGRSYYDLENYKNAQNLYEKKFQTIVNHDKTDIYVSKLLFQIYIKTNNSQKINKYIDYLVKNEKYVTDLDQKIILTEIIRDYHKLDNNYVKINEYNNKLIDLYLKQKELIQIKFAEVNNYLNETIIDDINQKYKYKLINQKRTANWIILTGVLSFLVLGVSFLTIRLKRKRERKIYHQSNTINEQNKLIMEKNIKLQDEKIKNLHLTLNLKQKTEQAFLEKVKKVRKSKKIDTEEILKELYLDLNNLIGIDKKTEYTEDNYTENSDFQDKISKIYPHLSKQELQLCVYFRLNLSSKEIAILEKITDGSVRVYKSKIKAKMNIPKDETIENYLNSI